GSTLIDASTQQSLETNIRPFSLGDVQMFVNTLDTLFEVDPTTALAFASAATDFQTGANGVSTGFASTDLAFDSTTPTTVTITAKAVGTAGNNIFVRLFRQDRGGQGPLLQLQQFQFGQTLYAVNITLDTDAANAAVGSGNPT